jgi:hypothetical protein
MSDHDLDELTLGPVILLEEFFASIQPIATRAHQLPEAKRHNFYIALLPYLIEHCRQVGLPQPHETALFLLRLVRENVAALLPTTTH